MLERKPQQQKINVCQLHNNFSYKSNRLETFFEKKIVILVLMTKSPKYGVVVTSNSAVSCEFLLIHHPSLLTPYASEGIASLSAITLV